MATMQPRQIAQARMLPYPSTASNVVHFTYEEPGVIYNNPQFTYEYVSYRGNAQVRTRRGAEMKGK